MSDKKDKTGSKGITDDLLEGFDDAFDDELDQAFESAEDPLKTTAEPIQYTDKGGSGDKTEFFHKDAEKTEYAPKNDEASERTQVAMTEDDSPLQLDTPLEPTRGAHEMKVPTEDLASLFQGDADTEGKTEDPTTFESMGSQRAPTEGLSALISEETGVSEGKTEHFEGKTEDLSSMIDSDLLEMSGPVSPVKNVNTSDLSSLIEEEISGEEEGKTEDLSSMIQSGIVEGGSESIDPLDIDRSNRSVPPPPKVPPKSSPKKELSKAPDPIPAADDYARSENSKTIRVWTKKQKIMMFGGLGGAGLLIIGGVVFFMLKPSQPSTPDPLAAGTEQAATPSQPEKIVESEELLRELEEKYQQSNQYFITDRFQSYTEATNRLEEILGTYPSHKKANSRLAEAILLKFDGYLDNDRRNRVYQLIEKAEAVDSNTVETLRAKARSLMVENKLKDASVRIQQALTLNADDFDSIQTQGEIQLALNDDKSALNSFAKAMQLEPKSVRAKYFYYLAKEKTGDLKTAKAGFNELASDMNAHPKSNIARFTIGMREGNFKKAREDLEQYLTEKDKDLSPYEAGLGWKTISEIALKEGSTQGAIDALEKSVAKMALNHKSTFELGNLYFKQKNYVKASQHYSTSVTLDPDNVMYLLQLGIALREQGRLKEAEEQLKKVTTKAPKNYDGLYEYAYTKYKLGFVDDVIAQLELNIKENPDFLQGKVLLGTIQVEKNDFKNSLANFEYALSRSKDKKITMLALMAMGDYYMKQELWSKAKQFYTQANQKDTENYDIHFALARIDIQLGQIKDAQSHLHQMQKINPASIEAKVLQAGILVEQENYDKAIEVYRDVLKTNEKDYETRISLAKVYMAKNQYAEALAELGQAYKYNADYYYTYFYLGLANRGLGDLAESERNLIKAIELMPKFHKAHYELGQTYLRKDDVKKGEDEMKAALAISPNYLPAMTAMGDYYFDHSGYVQANQYYEKALQSQPNQPELMLKQAKTLHEMGDDKRAIKIFQKILQQKPTSASIYYELGILYEENNDIPQALRMYQKSISLAPKDPKPHYQLGFLYKELRQNSKAIASFKTFLELSPNALDKGDIEDQIKKLGGKL